MRKLILADYLGICDDKGEPIGHTVKVLKEYVEMLSGEYEIILVSAKSTNDEIQYDDKRNIPYAINLCMAGKKHKIINIYKRMMNIKYLFSVNRDCPLWICSTDFYIFLYLFFSFGRKQKLILTLYRKNFDGEKFSTIKNFIYKTALKKVSLIVCSEMELDDTNIPIFHMPDYLFKREYYEKYIGRQKENKVICLGTMGKNKLLDELVDVFCKNGCRLDIRGKFSDEQLFQRLCDKATANIKIENSYISSQEYMELLASAKYAILPYDMNMYKERTSGVILESIFVGTIPVANQKLLDFMKIPGIGYTDLEELISTEWIEREIPQNYEEFVFGRYSYVKIREDLIRCINKKILL